MMEFKILTVPQVDGNVYRFTLTKNSCNYNDIETKM